MPKKNIIRSILNRFFLLVLFCYLLSCTNSNVPTNNETIIPKEVENPFMLIPTLKIKEQEWMCYDLSTEVFQNGDSIKFIDISEWDCYSDTSQPLACKYYFLNENNDSVYVCLYNWYAITDKRNIAPQGFRIATKDDYNTLFKSIKNQYKRLDVLFTKNDSLYNKHCSPLFYESANYKIVRTLKKRNKIFSYWVYSAENKQIQMVYSKDGYTETEENCNVYASFMEMYKSVAMPAKCIKLDY